MKVSELISHLKTFDQDLPVAVDAYEWGVTEVRIGNITVVSLGIDPDGDRGSMFGEWDEVGEKELVPRPSFRALVISRDETGS